MGLHRFSFLVPLLITLCQALQGRRMIQFNGGGSNGRDRGQSSRASRGGSYGGSIKSIKGPWTEEEDKILVEYVRKNGPCNWSSILSQGLLLRDGKSCRFRWINRLQPGLKTCKFSEEEGVKVIELQAKLGNKWATIATFLPGRTENDVKNFWSTRKKRLTRSPHDLLQEEATRQDSAHSQPLPLPRDQFAHILAQDSFTDHLRQFDDVDDDLCNRFMNCSPSMLELDAPPSLLTAPSQPSLDHHHLPQQLHDLPPDLALFQFQDPHFRHQLLPEEPRFFGVMRSEQETALLPDNFDELTPEILDFIDQQPPLLTAPWQPSLEHHHLPQQLLDLPPDLALFQFQDPHFSHQLLPEELPFFGVMRSEQETALPLLPDNFDELTCEILNFIDQQPPLLTAPSQPSLDHHHLPQQPPDLSLFQFQEPHFSHQLLPEEPRFFGVMRALPPDIFDESQLDIFDFNDQPPLPPTW